MTIKTFILLLNFRRYTKQRAKQRFIQTLVNLYPYEEKENNMGFLTGLWVMSLVITFVLGITFGMALRDIYVWIEYETKRLKSLD